MVVTCTDDAGAIFQVFSDGLPQRNAYHLAYLHGPAVTDDGQVPATTTGGLWLSTDAGMGWQCLSNDLPPVASVRSAD